ncbi:MAG: glycosyltransferase family 39 protein [Acidobacteriota bacterium]|nr:glycosyltransferase family 39 protein [Acidobacteriota bacterium]
MPPRTRERLLFAAWPAWAVLVISCYYVQLFRAAAVPRLPSPADLAAAMIPVMFVGAASLVLRVLQRQGVLLGRVSDSVPDIPPPAPRSRQTMLLAAGIMTIPWLMTRDALSATLSGVSAPGLPWFGEAAARSGSAFFGALLVAAAALAGGASVLRMIGWRTSCRVERIVFAAVTGAGVVSYGSLLLAFAGIYRPVVVALLIATLILTGLGLSSHATVERPLHDAAGVSTTTTVWYALTAVALGYGLIAALAPEKEYDALWYHLQLPRLWLEAGRPVDLIHEYVSLYPLTWELVFGAGMVLGGPVGAKLLHFACLPLLALLVWQAARRYMPGVSPAFAAALVVTTPTLLWESTTTYVDLALALHSAAACYALARYAGTKERGWGIVAALQFGLAASTKHLGVVVTIIALTLFVVAAARSRGGWTRLLRPAILIAMLAAAVPFPWYVRAWTASGNPVFPEMFALFGASPPARWDAMTDQGLARFKMHFGLGRSPAALLALPWNVTVHGALFGGSLGPLFLVLVPGLLFTRRHPAAVKWLVGGVVAYVAVWASPISSFQLRFLMPIVPPLALLAAAGLKSISVRAVTCVPRGHTIATCGVLCLAVFNLPPFTSFHEADRRGWNGWLTHVLRESPVRVLAGRESEAAYLRREVPSFGAWEAVNAQLPARVRVLAFSEGDQFYAGRPRVSHDATIARGAVWGAGAEDVDAAVAALRHLEITHVLFDRRRLGGAHTETLAIASPGMQQACIPEYDDGRYWVCRLDYGRLPAGPSRGME